MTRYDIAMMCGYNSVEEYEEAEKRDNEIFFGGLKEQKSNVEKEPVKIQGTQEKKYCRMIPLEPDCRGYTDVFICINCHQHIHLGFIRKEYSGSYCLECGAKVRDGNTEGKVNELNIKVNRPDGNCLDCKFQYLEDNYYWCSICPGNPEDI